MPTEPIGVVLFGTLVLLGALAGTAFGASTVRRVASASLIAVALALAFVVPTPPELAFWRGLTALGAMMLVMRYVEAWRARGAPVLPLAILFVLPVDVPSLKWAKPRLATESLARLVVHAVIMVAGLALVVFAERVEDARVPVRWLGGVVFVYGYLDVGASGARALLGAVGLDVAPMQRDPILSRSAGEHWGERWNRVVGSWLRRHVFLPVTRRTGSAIAGLAAAFGWSAFLHAFFVLAALGWRPALEMGAYFVCEGAIVLLESRLGLARWPRLATRVWAVLAVTGPSWLFVDPLLTLFGFP